MPVALRIAQSVACTEAEGPFRRYALWLQGCPLECPGCCNPELFDPARGRNEQVSALVEEILHARASLVIEGVTVLGGEPLEQLEAATILCEQVARAGLGVILFTGYTLAEARTKSGFSALWAALDTLVDGRFDARQPEHGSADGGRRFIGSANQCLHHRTPRYANPALWRGANHAELRVGPDGIASAHGFPREVRRLLVTLEWG